MPQLGRSSSRVSTPSTRPSSPHCYKSCHRMFDRRSAVRERRGAKDVSGRDETARFAPESTWTNVLFDRAPVPMWIVDRESSQIVAVNDAAVARYGYPR